MTVYKCFIFTDGGKRHIAIIVLTSRTVLIGCIIFSATLFLGATNDHFSHGCIETHYLFFFNNFCEIYCALKFELGKC